MPFLFLALVLSLGMGGCAFFEEKPTVIEWPFAQGDIFIDITADKNLNLYEGEPHALSVWIFQFSDPNSFHTMVASQEALARALTQGLGEDPTLLGTDRTVVYPGRRVAISLDRLQGAQHVGVVFGYFDLSHEDEISILYGVPLIKNQKGVLFTTSDVKPGLLWLKIALGTRKVVMARMVTAVEATALQERRQAEQIDQVERKTNSANSSAEMPRSAPEYEPHSVSEQRSAE